MKSMLNGRSYGVGVTRPLLSFETKGEISDIKGFPSEASAGTTLTGYVTWGNMTSAGGTFKLLMGDKELRRRYFEGLNYEETRVSFTQPSGGINTELLVQHETDTDVWMTDDRKPLVIPEPGAPPPPPVIPTWGIIAVAVGVPIALISVFVMRKPILR